MITVNITGGLGNQMFQYAAGRRLAYTFFKIPNQVAYVDHNYGDESYEDMRFMSQCKHHVFVNSSFSWKDES